MTQTEPKRAGELKNDSMTRLALLALHPVQYYSPLFRALPSHLDLHGFYADSATLEQMGAVQ